MSWIVPAKPKYVKCINNAALNKGDLEIDQVYQVLKEGVEIGSPSYKLFGKPSFASYRQSRFVSADAPTSSGTNKPTVATVPVDGKDKEEERLWKLLRPTQAPNECPCGSTRGVCVYHP